MIWWWAIVGTVGGLLYAVPSLRPRAQRPASPRVVYVGSSAPQDCARLRQGQTRAASTHRPREGAPAHLFPASDDGALAPDDICRHPEWYTGYPELAPLVMRKLRSVAGDPTEPLKIYRASESPGLRYGDWVTLSPQYARQHACYDDRYLVHAYYVWAKDVHWSGDDLMEWGWFGSGSPSPMEFRG